jgi:regulatory protein
MARARARRPLPPLNESKLNELALRYVGKYATTRAKLRGYLSRKLRERGWSGDREPDLDGLAARFSRAGYVDDGAYALSKSRTLSSRGYGKRRLVEKLHVAGVGEEDGRAAREHADAEALHSALRFAERKRLGPFGSSEGDPERRQREIAAMIRAGHPFPIAKAILSCPANGEVDLGEIADRLGLTLS